MLQLTPVYFLYVMDKITEFECYLSHDRFDQENKHLSKSIKNFQPEKNAWKRKQSASTLEEKVSVSEDAIQKRLNI